VTENGIIDSRQMNPRLKAANFVAKLLLCVNVLAYTIRFRSYPAILLALCYRMYSDILKISSENNSHSTQSNTPNIPLDPLPNIFSLCPSLNLRDQVLHLHKVCNIKPKRKCVVFCMEMTFETMNPTLYLADLQWRNIGPQHGLYLLRLKKHIKARTYLHTLTSIRMRYPGACMWVSRSSAP
jgi:hypothetical protein